MRRRFVVALVAALMAAGCVSAVAASDSTPVDCTIEANTLSCPLPEPPAPVTETATETQVVTETPDPVTETSTVTEVPPTVTETATVTVPTTATVPAGPETLFGDVTPGNAADVDTAKVELGVRFKPAVDGVVTGVRFYKGPGNTGVHTGSLWSGTVRVATVTFAGETESGWQTAKFATPVIVKAGTEYVASYLAPVGRYAGDSGYAWPKVSGNLTGLGSLYKYGGGRPTETFGGSNYYVDALFIATGDLPSTTPPATTPATTPPATTTAPTTTTPPPGTPVAYGWELNDTNTGLAGVGVNRSTLPVFNGPVTNGMTISNVKITGALDLSSYTNVTLDRVWVRVTNSNRAIIVGKGTTIKDSDIDGSGMPTGERFGVSSQPGVGTQGDYSILRTNITGTSIGIYLDSQSSAGSGLISDTYIHNMISTGGAHIDGFTRRVGSAPVTVQRSRIVVDYSDSGGTHATGALFLATTYGAISGVTLKDSLFEGNGYNMHFASNGPQVSVGLDNIRLRSTEYAVYTASGNVSYTSWANVHVYDPSKPNAAGAVVNHQ